MARSLATQTNVNPPDSDYPYGRTRDNDGSGNGTPVNERLLGDIIQFFEHMMSQAGVSHNGLPDNDYSGFQYFEALTTYIANRVRNNLQATEALRGSAEIATQTETNNGADDARIVTPLKLATRLVNNQRIFRNLVYTSATDVNNFEEGTIAHISGSFTNAPSATAADRWIVLTVDSGVTNGELTQLAIQTENANAGNIYVRVFPAPSGPWGSWTLVNS